MEQHWSAVQGWLGELLMERGVDRISAEELTVPPGMDELFALLQLKRAHGSGDWDVIVVDCAPTGETLRLLSFPDVSRWWLEKVFPWEKQILAVARPLARSVFDVPIPSEAVFADVKRLSESLIALNEILRDRERASVRLVMNPDRMVIGEAMRTFTYLNLYGYLTDAVVVNRIFPEEVGEYFGAVARAPARAPRARRIGFRARSRAARAVLRRGGRRAGHARPPGRHRVRRPRRPTRCSATSSCRSSRSARTTPRCGSILPFADKGDIALKKIGAELVVRVDGQKRTIMLPPALAASRPRAASFEDGALEVSFDVD